MKALFDQVSIQMSKLVTRAYSTSFSWGIFFLYKKLHNPIYAIYGFVRLADEIVDSFHDFNKAELLEEFKADTYKAIDRKISLNPILNSFQVAVHQYDIDKELIDTFLHSMEMDLEQTEHNRASYETYILGSAEVVGLMCLKVFVDGDQKEYERLKPYAMKLGSAFQKINFLRDLHADYNELGRAYFPGVEMQEFDNETKQKIEAEIAVDFAAGLEGIKMLPPSSRLGTYIAYVYFYSLLKKIQSASPNRILQERVRIANGHKIALLFRSYLKYNLNLF